MRGFADASYMSLFIQIPKTRSLTENQISAKSIQSFSRHGKGVRTYASDHTPNLKTIGQPFLGYRNGVCSCAVYRDNYSTRDYCIHCD